MTGGSVPAPPDPNQAAQAGIISDVANYPQNWDVNSAAQTGSKVTINGTTYDFSGLGNADQANALSDQAAQALLDIQNNYGSAFVQQRLADLKQSDPTGYAARQQLFDKISQDAQANPDRPMADDLQTQVSNELQNSGQLDPQGLQEVQQGVRGQQVSNGIYLGNSATSQEADAVTGASDALQTGQQQQALGYLQSGVSPSDVEYRRIEQSLGNLGAFVNGQTPEAQFGSLSAAGNGAAPFSPVNYSTPQNFNPNAAATGLSQANSIFGQQSNFYQSQSNPWLAGASIGITGLKTAGQLGYSPFSTGTNYQNPNPWNAYGNGVGQGGGYGTTSSGGDGTAGSIQGVDLPG